VIGEIGWPSEGRTRESAVATKSNQALFLRRFLAYAERQGYVYYVMEAFDQPWKAQAEGKVGAYWGVYDADRQQKFSFREPIVRVPNWHVLARRPSSPPPSCCGSSTSTATRCAIAAAVSRDRRVRHGDAGHVDPLRLSQQYLTVTSALVGALLFIA